MTGEDSTTPVTDRSGKGARLIAALAVTAAIIGGGIWLWEVVLEYKFIPKRFGVVEAGAIYRSGQLSPEMIGKTLRKHAIEVVVSLRPDEPGNAEHEAERRAVENLGLEWKMFPLDGDGTGDITSYADAIEAITDAKAGGRPVLVHCAAGAYRTGGVIAAYRMLVTGHAPGETWVEMTRFRWNEDNPILPEYLNGHMRELATLLVARGVIDEVPDPLPVLEAP